MTQWLSMRIHNTGVVSEIPPCVTVKTPLVKMTTGNYIMNSTSLKELRAMSLVSATLEIEYATQLYIVIHNAVNLIIYKTD